MSNIVREKNEVADEGHDLAAAAAGDNIQKRQAIEVTEEARIKEYKLPSFGGQLFMSLAA